MRANNIFRKVGGILSEINEQYRYLSESSDNLNELELELLSANADFLAEHIKVLKKLNSSQDNSAKQEPASSQEKLAVEPQFQKYEKEPENIPVAGEVIKDDVYPSNELDEDKTPLENEAVPEAELTSAAIPVYPQGIEEYNTLVEEDQSEIVEEQADRNVAEINEAESSYLETPVPVINEESSSPTQESSPVINEVIIEEKIVNVEVPSIAEMQEKVPTLNEMMSAQRPQNNSIGLINKQAVTDLKAIINLNDKLLFIKDLFNGYSLAYSEAIEIINRFDSFEAADNFLKTNYAGKNNWASRQGTADKLYELLNRRFSANS
ncbi:hypothetical protein WG906_16870 [Pedobacter sp. P351]|uniref:hypothetical protein n=1 Tax=Pedobacter superstes TaxID=3133441 RepID=UPI0030B24EAA